MRKPARPSSRRAPGPEFRVSLALAPGRKPFIPCARAAKGACVRIKQRPEDFSVKESYRFDEVPGALFRVYLMDKQKLSTFEAVDRIRDAFGLKPGAISFCGLKDKQGRTEQIIAVQGSDVDVQEANLRLKYLGRTDKPLSAANITSNRFAVTVRSLDESVLGPLNGAAAEVNRLGVVNYFDSQRFGSLKHGQGFIAKDLIRGDFEAALRNYFAKPSELDRTEDAKVKQFWRENWGRWDARVPFEGSKKYHRILRSLRDHPGDYVRAFLQIDADYRAMLLFTYQSYLWNEGVRRYLQLLMPREHLFPLRYQAGTLLFHRDASPEALRTLRDATFPLLGPDSTFKNAQVEEAVQWVLGREKLALKDLRIEESPRLLFFKSEERPVLVFPHKLVLGRPQRDELNRGSIKSNVAFTLPPGAYATLVVKRLFHFSWREDSPADIRASQRPRLTEVEQAEAPRAPEPRARPSFERAAPGRAAPGRVAPGRSAPERSRAPGRAASFRPAEPPPPESPSPPPPGYRETQRIKKEAKQRAQAETAAKSSKSKKKK
ncbi:tRNA pseudouridine(13) synthase TruD [Stigmatella sp. ncwal1]|uniref:tRNA pseudouridine(13) synthase TruD n=1 Tax=Stigmatella ashevillensis TaxID=2995309 RepID=A0ABT5D225_9BACT|nr:tRNA pseudouridine(13) synthase TruD [Stigmatella ashevillena]MDC0707715.1 tRNA pseudouridine(13) synthase TruD [Stigmatella ashevillena]